MDTAPKTVPDDVFVIFETEVRIGDENWQLPNRTAGQRDSHTNLLWNFDLFDGTKLTDAVNAKLLRELCLFVVSKVLDPRGSKAPKVGTVIGYGHGLRLIARWMRSRGYKSLEEINSLRSMDFACYCAEVAGAQAPESEALPPEDMIGAEDLPKDVSFQTAWSGMNTLVSVFKQRDAMHELGSKSVQEIPFEGRSSSEVLRDDFSIEKIGKLKPVPDDVNVPFLNTAARMLGAPAKDIIELQTIYTCVLSMPPSSERLERYRSNIREFRDFEFSTIDGEQDAWRTPIRPYKRTYRDGRVGTIKESQAVRRIIMDLQVACAVVIQAATGLRAHELLGAEIEPELSKDGLPSCIETELTRDGTMIRYYLQSQVLKHRERDERWLLGARIVESKKEPVAVQAIKVLYELNKPWRELANEKYLLVSFSNEIGLPRHPTSVKRMTTDGLSNGQKDFLFEHVDLSGASEESRSIYADGSGLRPHQWRTTVATFVMRVNPKLLPALSDHFKHVNAVVTMDGYIGLNPELREAMDGARNLASSAALIRLTDPESRLIGGGADLFHQNSKKLREMIDERPGNSLEERTLSLVEEHELHIYDAAHGYCLSAFAPSQSRCRNLAGYAGALRPYPHDLYRSVPVCSQCPLLVITREHLEFHRERAIRSERDRDRIEREEQPGVFKVLSDRIRQSRQMSKLLDADRDG